MKFVKAFLLSIAMLPAISTANDVLAMASTAENEALQKGAIADSTLNAASTVNTVSDAVAENKSGDASAANTENAEEAGSEENVASAEPEDSEELDSLQESNLEADAVQFLDFSGAHFPTIHGTRMNSPYGIRKHRLHRGVDMHITIGDSIVAAYPGKVVVSKYNRRGYGHYVMIEHENGTRTLYGHLKKRLVNVGDTVEGGQLVGWGGNTGRSSGPHLHFEIRYGDINIDPETIVDFPNWELKPGVNKISKKKITSAHNNMQRKLNKENRYTVKKGDTQWKVAKWFNISVEALCRLNNLKPGAPLKVGQRLIGSK